MDTGLFVDTCDIRSCCGAFASAVPSACHALPITQVSREAFSVHPLSDHPVLFSLWQLSSPEVTVSIYSFTDFLNPQRPAPVSWAKGEMENNGLCFQDGWCVRAVLPYEVGEGMKLPGQVRGRPRVPVTLTSTAKAQIWGSIWLRGRNGQDSGTYKCQVRVRSPFRDVRGGEHLCLQTLTTRKCCSCPRGRAVSQGFHLHSSRPPIHSHTNTEHLLNTYYVQALL